MVDNSVASSFINKSYSTTQSRYDLFKLYEELKALIVNGDWITYSNILDEIDISLISNELIMGLLRTSYLFRDKIKGWEAFLIRAEIELSKRNSVKLLNGLI